jgi:hypothetical protein
VTTTTTISFACFLFILSCCFLLILHRWKKRRQRDKRFTRSELERMQRDGSLRVECRRLR